MREPEVNSEVQSLESGADDQLQTERPPGGGSLTRLLQMLESAGYVEEAESAVATAIADEDLAAFEAFAPEVTAAPPDGPESYLRADSEADDDAASAARDAAPSTQAMALQYQAASSQMGPPTGTGPRWRSLGPRTITNGQTYGASRVNVSGRISSVVVDPSNRNHVLIGAANGGVWESFNRGGSWSPRSDYAPTLATGALAFDPSNPRTVYCGTGEGDWWAFLGQGVLRSTNGGTTWSVLCTAPFVGDGFYDIVVDPADGQHLLAGTRRGLYVSNDGGVNWTRERAQRTWSISINPAGGASAELLAACADGLVRSTDGGANWNQVALPGEPASFTRLEVAIAPSSPGVAYAWGAQGNTAFLWRRTGGTWTAIGAPPGVSVGQAWYDWFLAVSPDSANRIYCGAIEVHRGTLSGGTWNWVNITDKDSSGDSIHPDQHAIAFDPTDARTIYVGNDGGLYRSGNRGTNWTHCNNGLAITEFEYIAQDLGQSRWLIGGTQDNGTNRYTGSSTWAHVGDADGGDCGVNRTDPQTVFMTWQRGGDTRRLRVWRSTTGGGFGSFTTIFPRTAAGEGSLFYPPFEASATGGNTIAAGGDSLYVSRNDGTNWTRLPYPVNERSSALYVPDANNIYVGTTGGRIYTTRWNGSRWSNLRALSTPRNNAFVSDLYVDPRNRNRMWATYRTIGGGRAFLSTDGGTTWRDRTAGLPNLPMNAVAVDTRNANRVWVGGDLGVYETRNGGASWTDFSNGLPNMYVGDLLFHEHARVLRAGTRNRGIWEIPVDGWPTRPQCGRQFTGTLGPRQSRRWFTFNWPATWHVVWTAMPTTVRRGAPQLTWNVQVERANAEFVTYWITVRNLTNSSVNFDGRYCILSRY